MIRSLFRKISDCFRKVFANRYFPFILSCLAIVSGLLTYVFISYGGVSLAKRTSVVMPFVVFNFILITLLSLVIFQKIIWIFKNHKKGVIGSHLHMTIVSLFSIVTMTPAIVVAVLAVIFFKTGVSIWFSQPVKDTLYDANTVAELYLQEHMRSIRGDALIVANKLKLITIGYDLFSVDDRLRLKKELDEIIEQHNLDEALIFAINKNSRLITHISSSLAFSLELSVDENTNWDDLNIAATGEIVVKENQGVMHALSIIDSDLQDSAMYLWVGKEIDQNILKYVTKARDSTKYYNDLLANHKRFQIILITLFALASLLLLLASIWIGILLAGFLVEPITKLIEAADSVSNGDLSIRVDEISHNNELNSLIRSFNRMTERLEKQNKDLIISEKKSAWSDIARKIAHEVKNPLTPIQLSAERLKKKFIKEIKTDPDTFTKCVDTIIRQVSHIENLINEFSTFARMPEAVIKPVNITQIIREVVFLQRQVYQKIKFVMEFPKETVLWACDSSQISRLLINIIQNACNSITENNINEEGQVTIFVYDNYDNLQIFIEDNGPGFPKDNREKLFEPYYTTRKKGTGLGMAIVLRIVTDHFGTMELKDANGHQGALVEINLPRLDYEK